MNIEKTPVSHGAPTNTSARLVVNDVEEFVRTAVLVAQNRDVREQIQRQLSRALELRPLYDDRTAVDEWEGLLLAIAGR